jgi:hypothetical protein
MKGNFQNRGVMGMFFRGVPFFCEAEKARAVLISTCLSQIILFSGILFGYSLPSIKNELENGRRLRDSYPYGRTG